MKKYVDDEFEYTKELRKVKKQIDSQYLSKMETVIESDIGGRGGVTFDFDKKRTQKIPPGLLGVSSN